MLIHRIERPSATGVFERSVKRLEKRFPHVSKDIDDTFDSLLRGEPVRNDPVIGFGGSLLKIRVRSTDMQRGSSGGFRVLLYRIDGATWTPLFCYAKADMSDLPRGELRKLVEQEVAELRKR